MVEVTSGPNSVKDPNSSVDSGPVSVMFVAAEASSSHYALKILQEWKRQGRNIHAFGVGSQDMENLGFERLGKSEEMAVVGASEIIAQYEKLKAVFDRLVEEAARRRPRVVVVMDYPEFNLMLSKKMKALGLKVVYYISPQVWAWRKGRVKTIKKYCDKALLLFPFEVAFYEQHEVPCEFVGHPLLDEVDEKFFDPEYRKLHRNRCGIQDQEMVLGLMPGSRRLELKNHLPQQLRVAGELMRKHPNLRLVILCAPTIEKEQILAYMEDFRFSFQLLRTDPFEMIHLVDVMLAASGTATLQVGLLEKPMVIMYRMSNMTALFAKLVVKGYFGLVNLILGEEVVPERFQWRATDEELFKLLDQWISNPQSQAPVIQKLKLLKSKLGDRGATSRVVKILERYLS
ncbi:MAG: lipid-A-disaccharide synthase [Bdellovibrionales bacterium]